MTDTMDQIRGVTAARQRQAEQAYQELARRLALGETVDPDEAGDTLFAVERSAEDLGEDVRRLKSRLADQATAGRLPEIEKELAQVDADLRKEAAEIDAALEASNRRINALADRRRALTTERTASRRAWSRTLQVGVPAEMQELRQAAGKRVVAAQERVEVLHTAVLANQNFVATAERRVKESGTSEARGSAQTALARAEERLAQRKAELADAERELSQARTEAARLETASGTA